MKAPVTYQPNLINGNVGWLTDLTWRVMPWEHRDNAPRFEAWFNSLGLPYTYGSGEYARTYQAHDLDQPQGAAWLVRQVMNSLNEQGHDYNCCFVNGYETGRQHLGWHSDDSPEMDPNHPIATVSLGAEREIWFRPIGDRSGDAVEKLLLQNGSAATMAAGMQQSWQHRIPKSSKADCGPRISLTYRRLLL